VQTDDASKLNLDFQKILDPRAPESECKQIISDFCHINLSDLQTALARHAGIYAYASATYEAFQVQEARDKWSKEQAESQAFDKLLQDWAKNKEGKDPTVSGSTLKIRLDPTFSAAQQRLLDTQSTIGRLKALVKGLEHRKDMLVQVAARQRREEENTP
jgi:hypothetical protein